MKRPKLFTPRVAASPLQIARFGHIAATLRAELEKRGWGIGDFNKAIGYPPDRTNAWVWLAGKSAPGPKMRPKVAKALGIDPALLIKREGVTGAMLIERPAPGYVVTAPLAQVLLFSVMENGTARLKLDITLPIAQATPLLRMLLDAGVAFEKEEETTRP